MQPINKILVVVDPTVERQNALRRATWLSRHCGAAIELVICDYNDYIDANRIVGTEALGDLRDQMLNEELERLESLAAPLRESGIDVNVTAVWDHPLHEGIVRHALRCKADIVLKDTHHHTALSRAFLTNTDWNLIRSCPTPLWLVREGEFNARPNIVAAIDPMNEHDKPAELDDTILWSSRYLSEMTNGSVQAFHSYDPRLALAASTMNAYIPVSLPLEEIEDQMREERQARVQEIADFHQLGAESVHLASGKAHEEIPAFAKAADADLVVMGAVSRGRWKRLQVGSTAERTLEFLPCDLLIVKPAQFVSPVTLDDQAAA